MPMHINSLNAVDKFLSTDANKRIAQDDILSLNEHLLSAQALISEFPPTKISVNNIRYKNPFSSAEVIDYCNIIKTPKTPTGKPPKFPLKLNFFTAPTTGNFTTDNVFGEIYYLPEGNIGKARIIRWSNRKLYVVYISIKNNKLVVSKIETNNSNHIKETIYKI